MNLFLATFLMLVGCALPALLLTPVPVNAQELVYATGSPILLAGDPAPGTMQWFKDASPLEDNERVAGSTSSVLHIDAAQEDDSGTYLLLNTITFWLTNWTQVDGQLTEVVSSTNVISTNTLYQVLVQEPPRITVFRYSTAGDTVIFEVEATGTDLQYQWFWQGQPIPDATQPVLEYPHAQSSASAGYYSVEVRNRAGVAMSPPPGLLFLKAMPRGSYQGLFYDSSHPALPTSGRVDFKISTARGAYSGKLNLFGKYYSFSGSFDDQHWTHTVATPKGGGTPLEITAQLSTVNNTPEFAGSVSDGNWTVPLRGYKLPFDTVKNRSPLAGQYTMALVNTNVSGPGLLPNGNGFGALSLGAGGNVKLTGRTAEGTPFSHAAGLSQGGEWPLYVVLPKGRGAIFGWMQFGGVGGALSTQGLHWIKPAGPDTFYPGGYNLSLDVLGSSYTPDTTSLLLDEAVASIAAGDLFTDDLAVWNFYRIWQREPNQWAAEKSPAKLQLSFGNSRGFMSGSFINYRTGLRTPIRGIVLQQQSGVLGYFLSVNSSGYFSITSGAGD